jgi:allophanate hydrolase
LAHAARLADAAGRTMTFDVLQGSLDIDALRAHYASGALTPEALVEALYARMDVDAPPGVWIHRLPKQTALQQARALGAFHPARSGPLSGIPFAVKDNIDVADMPTTAACPAFAYQPTSSAPSVQALLDAGALCLGKLNLDQFATGLVGTRSPYGVCRNVFDPELLAGGSSSGSAVAVAAHQVSFALGTDTAGSGRVPAALNNVVGLKPSLGLISTQGMVPACASLDCVSVFALCVADARRVRDVLTGGPLDAQQPLPARFRFGVPQPLELFGDALSQRAFTRAVEQLRSLGGSDVPVAFASFAELGDMLYGPSVLERYLAVGSFIEQQPDAVLPVTRDIILAGKQIGPAQALAGMSRIAALRLACQRALAGVDLLLTPSTPSAFRIADDAREPRVINDRQGIYTRFVNYLGCPVLAVPAGFRADGVPFGVSLVGRTGQDAQLDALGAQLHAHCGAGKGTRRDATPPVAYPAPAPDARLAVVGAHMSGLALNGQLLELGARFVRTACTAEHYRLFVLPGTRPERPGLVRVEGPGHAIEVELWDMSWAALGALLAKVPAPLSIGTLTLADGESVRGFLCEPYATTGAREISQFGGYRSYLEQTAG